MTIQTAVILAAGMGTRLKELGQSRPKGFLRLGKHSIIEESIERLQACGIERVIIVTGYKAEFYEQLKLCYPQVTTVHNPHWATSGSMYSLYCARQILNQDFLLLESDLVYEVRSIEAVLAFPQDNVILLSGHNQAGDEVFVETRGKTIWAMSKRLEALSQPPTGELVGICKISQSLFQRILIYAKAQFKTTLKVDYETDALVTVAQSYPIYYILIPDLLWTEIDDAHHLARARTHIYPRIISLNFKRYESNLQD